MNNSNTYNVLARLRANSAETNAEVAERWRNYFREAQVEFDALKER
jgi:hypothetical protein